MQALYKYRAQNHRAEARVFATTPFFPSYDMPSVVMTYTSKIHIENRITDTGVFSVPTSSSIKEKLSRLFLSRGLEANH